MGLSIGRAKFKDGALLYFDYQNTEDVVSSGLKKYADDASEKLTTESVRITSQPTLADMHVEYGNGLSWTSWCSDDKTQVILNFSAEQAASFESVFSYGIDQHNVAHLIKEVSGFGYAFSEIACNYSGKKITISAERAEGKLCLECLNKHLKIS